MLMPSVVPLIQTRDVGKRGSGWRNNKKKRTWWVPCQDGVLFAAAEGRSSPIDGTVDHAPRRCPGTEFVAAWWQAPDRPGEAEHRCSGEGWQEEEAAFGGQRCLLPQYKRPVWAFASG